MQGSRAAAQGPFLIQALGKVSGEMRIVVHKKGHAQTVLLLECRIMPFSMHLESPIAAILLSSSCTSLMVYGQSVSDGWPDIALWMNVKFWRGANIEKLTSLPVSCRICVAACIRTSQFRVMVSSTPRCWYGSLLDNDNEITSVPASKAD